MVIACDSNCISSASCLLADSKISDFSGETKTGQVMINAIVQVFFFWACVSMIVISYKSNKIIPK